MSESNPAPDLFDPSAHKVAEVNEYLLNADADERARVLALEDARDGGPRATVQRDFTPAQTDPPSPVGPDGIPVLTDEKVAPKQYADPSWSVGQLAPASRYRIFDDKTAVLGPVQDAAPKPGQSGVIVALEGAPITAGVRYELENN